MRIALVCHVRYPIARPFAGGLEAHNWHLAAALEARGHEVTLFASGDSDPRFRIVPIVDRHVESLFPGREHSDDAELKGYVDAAYASAAATFRTDAFDIVHNHSLHRFVLGALGDVAAPPAISTFHTPPLGGLPAFAALAASPRHQLTCVSRAQRNLWWPDGAPPGTKIIANGIDLDRWPVASTSGIGAIWAGRIARTKAPHHAIAAAAAAGMPLVMAGPIEDDGYWTTEIAPRLGTDVQYIGHVDQSTLSAAFRAAALFLATPDWDEPFGLSAVEALASGLPVAAVDQGAIREVVGEVAGRYAPSGDITGLAAAMKATAAITRTVARGRADGFSLNVMVNEYEARYMRVARFDSLGSCLQTF